MKYDINWGAWRGHRGVHSADDPDVRFVQKYIAAA
jgi:hypothetical protein